ncbi:hypothetical protein NDU88_007400 [Pleurodeles waltl]|uniref:Uncharacterized protein n=1 Tax=Pleurodeles waltl TaxID=8319 RepID=A0AAV7PMG6_PLEWA|nr:hypothetical protein NDU88_007400 [Pleurodeles waltl]
MRRVLLTFPVYRRPLVALIYATFTGYPDPGDVGRKGTGARGGARWGPPARAGGLGGKQPFLLLCGGSAGTGCSEVPPGLGLSWSVC